MPFIGRLYTEFRWVSYGTAMRLLRSDSNRTALWELDLRLRRESSITCRK
jgi:hypothetical protein